MENKPAVSSQVIYISFIMTCLLLPERTRLNHMGVFPPLTTCLLITEEIKKLEYVKTASKTLIFSPLASDRAAHLLHHVQRNTSVLENVLSKSIKLAGLYSPNGLVLAHGPYVLNVRLLSLVNLYFSGQLYKLFWPS